MPKSLRSPRHMRLQALLVNLRRAQGLTQEELAQRLGKSQSFIAKTEGGERRLDVIEFIDLAEALHQDAVRLLGQLVGDLEE